MTFRIEPYLGGLLKELDELGTVESYDIIYDVHTISIDIHLSKPFWDYIFNVKSE